MLATRFADHVATLTIDRPDMLNAIDLATEAELQRIWTDHRSRPRRPRRGADRRRRARLLRRRRHEESGNKTGLEYWAAPRPGGFGGIALRETLDVPVIARVNGFALGGGFEMVLGCDIVVACDEASFGLPEPRVGRLPLDGGMTLLQRQIAFRPAMGMLLTGRRIDAARALDWGLSTRSCRAPSSTPPSRAGSRTSSPARRCRCGRSSRWCGATGSMTPAEAQAQRLPALIEALESEDSQEGVLAFREKRAPVWKGRCNLILV